MRWKRRPEGSNWGEFGADDQMGRMNMVTPEARLRGIREAREGLAFCLSLPLDYPGGNVLAPYRHEPKLFVEKRGNGHNYNFPLRNLSEQFIDIVSDDAVLLYTQYSTQWDSLGHVGQYFDADGDGVPEKVYYNGYRGGLDIVGPDESATERGAKALGIENLAASCVQGRGILVDLELVYGQQQVAVGYDDLMRAMDRNDTAPEPGDFLCLHTGFAELVLSMKKTPDRDKLMSSCAALDGRDERLLRWLDQSGIVAICADNFAVEAYPAKPGKEGGCAALPLHELCLFKLGIHLGELWHFAELARWLRANDRSSFLLTAPPLRLPGAVGSPVTPIATV